MNTAIIIVNFNDEDETISYVEKINKYKVLNRIIVVDNKSTTIGAFNKLQELEKIDKKITVIETEKNGGYSYGNNFGVRYLEKEGKRSNHKFQNWGIRNV